MFLPGRSIALMTLSLNGWRAVVLEAAVARPSLLIKLEEK
jgi:hypothetical protein